MLWTEHFSFILYYHESLKLCQIGFHFNWVTQYKNAWRIYTWWTCAYLNIFIEYIHNFPYYYVSLFLWPKTTQIMNSNKVNLLIVNAKHSHDSPHCITSVPLSLSLDFNSIAKILQWKQSNLCELILNFICSQLFSILSSVHINLLMFPDHFLKW